MILNVSVFKESSSAGVSFPDFEFDAFSDTGKYFVTKMKISIEAHINTELKT